VKLFSKLFMTDNAAGEEDHVFDQLESYPKAEFPGRLLIPDDLAGSHATSVLAHLDQESFLLLPLTEESAPCILSLSGEFTDW
jgi:hypothetical protein